MDGRIAFCYSGQLRKLTKVYRPGKDYRDYDNIFIHTWDHIDNPNLKVVEKYFNSSTIKVEDYSNFDKIAKNLYYPSGIKILNNPVNTGRYQYAQFYTVYKSLELAMNSDISETFKYFVRSRTDILGVERTLKDSNYYTSLIATEERRTKEYLKNVSSGIVDLKYNFFEHPSDGIVLADISSIFNNTVLFSDFHFVISRTAVLKLLSYTIEEFMKLVSNLWLKVDSTGIHFNPSSPVVWYELFKTLGINIINYQDTANSILRDNDDLTIKEFYGPIG